MSTTTSMPARRQLHRVVIRFAGDSGDGMQLTGDRFTAQTATLGNDLATLPDYPSEIRAPAGTVAGVSSFQLQLADGPVLTPGDRPDVLVAMNAAALRKYLGDLPDGGVVIVNTDGFARGDLKKAGYDTDPLTDGTLDGYRTFEVAITELTVTAVADLVEIGDISKKDAQRAKNMFALGLVSWMYSRPIDVTLDWLASKFAARPAIAAANRTALKAGWHYGETTDAFAHTYQIAPAALPAGTYRNISGNTATAYGLIAAAVRSGLPLFFGAYPITPATDILHELVRHKRFGVTCYQAEDEIAAIGAALGASFGGVLGVTATSGPGMALKTETIGLAISVELPLVIVNVQRGGPSTGLPTKTEQSDLLQAMYGRNGDAPLPVLAARSPSDCFHTAIEAVRIAVVYRTPVVLLTDGYLGNGTEPWLLPDPDSLPVIDPAQATGPNGPDGTFLPFLRDPDTLARPWAAPGTPGLAHRIGGLEKADVTGDVSYAPDNHQTMTDLRAAKVAQIDVPDVTVDGPGTGDLLVVGWGSTYGAIATAVDHVNQAGGKVAHAHLTHLNPLPANLGDVLSSYRRVLVPELNAGQLALLLRAGYRGVDVVSHSQVRGQPFRTTDLIDVITATVDGSADVDHTDLQLGA